MTNTKVKKWDYAEKANWLSQQNIKRSYLEEVVSKIKSFETDFDVEQYGALTYAPHLYPLFIVKSKKWDINKKSILVTGGVHGYETSGVHGALFFVETQASKYAEYFNIVVAPCISPWGYETINRWNPNTVDPNRSFYHQSPAEESSKLMQAIEGLIAHSNAHFIAHIDLHETTDTDNSEFRPALASRDGIVQDNWNIPDGFYLVGDSENPQEGFQKAMIDSVEKITHIAPADEQGKIIGADLAQKGVINYPVKKLSLCAGLTNSQYVTTTEVYPDSPKVTDQNCIDAQVAAIVGGLDYLIQHKIV
jgi:hypothetical protein